MFNDINVIRSWESLRWNYYLKITTTREKKLQPIKTTLWKKWAKTFKTLTSKFYARWHSRVNKNGWIRSWLNGLARRGKWDSPFIETARRKINFVHKKTSDHTELSQTAFAIPSNPSKQVGILLTIAVQTGWYIQLDWMLFRVCIYLGISQKIKHSSSKRVKM